MSFLAPLFLLGGLAVALPVVFHLVRRSSREKLVFSSLMFLKPTPPRMTRRNRLENIFLLLLRCLAICLLALGFARPFFQKPMAATPTGAGGEQLVLLVDGSASMKREGVWAAARAKAESVLKETDAADQVAVMVFDDRVRTIVSFEQWSQMNPSERADLAAQGLADEEPSWRSTHLGNALITAAEAIEDLEKREQHTGPRRIVLVSDMQEGARLDGLQGHEWPVGLEVVVESVGAKRSTNAGLQWVMATDDSTNPSADSAVRIRVSNSADATREQFRVAWAGVADAPSLDAYVPPGQSRIMAAPPLPTNVVGERIVLSGDDGDFDNTAYVVQPQPEQVDVLHLGDDAADDPAQLLYYLRRGFQDTRWQTVRLVAVGSGVADGPPPHVGGYRLVIVADTLSEARAGEVREFLEAGGTVLVVMKEARVAGTIRQLTGVAEVNATEAGVSDYAMFGELDFTHPLLAPFSDPRFGDFTKVRFWKHRRLDAEQLPEARIVARFDDNDPAIIELPVGRGRVFVFTFSWKPEDSQFALSSKFVPLLYSMLDQAGGVGGPLSQFRVGEEVDLAAHAGGSGGARLTIRKPGGSRVELAVGETRFPQTDEPGIYEVLGGEALVRFAVNLDAAESRTAPRSADELERLGVPMKTARPTPAQQLARTEHLHHAELEARQKLWRWLILAALTVLLVETWLAGWITRRPARNAEVTV